MPLIFFVIIFPYCSWITSTKCNISIFFTIFTSVRSKRNCINSRDSTIILVLFYPRFVSQSSLYFPRLGIKIKFYDISHDCRRRWPNTRCSQTHVSCIINNKRYCTITSISRKIYFSPLLACWSIRIKTIKIFIYSIIFSITSTYITISSITKSYSITPSVNYLSINSHYWWPICIPLFRFQIKTIEIIKKFPIPIYCIIR